MPHGSRNRYFETVFAVGDRLDAEFLQNRNNWDVIGAIKDAGVEGITSAELAKRLGIPYKTVAVVTKQLSQQGWITSEPRRDRRVGRPRKEKERKDFRKPPNVHVWARLNAPLPKVWEDFHDFCIERFDQHSEKIQSIVELVDHIITEIKKNSEARKFAPTEPIHEDCGSSHEGYECGMAVLVSFITKVIGSKEFSDVLLKHGLANETFFEES